MSYVFDAKRYDGAQFRRCGRSGMGLPPVSLGLWQNFGGVDVFETGRAVIRRAFDRGMTHFDLAMGHRMGRSGRTAKYLKGIVAASSPSRKRGSISAKNSGHFWTICVR